MKSKYIKDSKVIKVSPGEVVLEVTINTELLVEDIAEGLTSIIAGMATEIRECLKVIVTFIDALPKRVQDEISKGLEE